MKYLTKTSNNYYKLRIRIPKALQVHFRRNEINKSLNTTNFAFAKKQALSILNDYQKICLMYQLKLNDKSTLKNILSNDIQNKILFSQVVELLQNARQQVLRTVNSTMVYTYFEIGRVIVEEEQNGKDRAVGFLVGQIMKATRGQANPGVVNKLLQEELSKR